MTLTPLVSVVMSVYNEADHVERATRSILDQTLRDFELIVINDGSTDASGSLLESLASTDPRLRVIHQGNTGLTCALIRGCSEARGEFIARQDSDDWSHPLRLAEQVALIRSDSRIGFASCATEYVGPEDEHLAVVRRPIDPAMAAIGLLEQRQGPPAHGSVMFRKSLYEQVGGYRAEFHYAQDTDLWLRMAENMFIGYVDAIRYRHRKDARSISGARRQQQSEFSRFAHVCRRARLAGVPEREFLDGARALTQEITLGRGIGRKSRNKGTAEISYLIGSQLVLNGDARAPRYLIQVIRSRPWHLKAWLRLVQSMPVALRQVAFHDRDE